MHYLMCIRWIEGRDGSFSDWLHVRDLKKEGKQRKCKEWGRDGRAAAVVKTQEMEQ